MSKHSDNKHPQPIVVGEMVGSINALADALSIAEIRKALLDRTVILDGVLSSLDPVSGRMTRNAVDLVLRWLTHMAEDLETIEQTVDELTIELTKSKERGCVFRDIPAIDAGTK